MSCRPSDRSSAMLSRDSAPSLCFSTPPFVAFSPFLINMLSVQQSAPSSEPAANKSAASKAIADGTAVLASDDSKPPNNPNEGREG